MARSSARLARRVRATPTSETGARAARNVPAPPSKEACIPLLKAVADETRWEIVRELLTGPRTVGELVERLDATQYNVSKHLRVLRETGIVEMARDGKHVRCGIADNFRQLSRNAMILDLGCCTFRFE